MALLITLIELAGLITAVLIIAILAWVVRLIRREVAGYRRNYWYLKKLMEREKREEKRHWLKQ